MRMHTASLKILWNSKFVQLQVAGVMSILKMQKKSVLYVLFSKKFELILDPAGRNITALLHKTFLNTISSK